MHEPKCYDPNAENPPWIKALADVRHLAREKAGPARQGNHCRYRTNTRNSSRQSKVSSLNRPYSIGDMMEITPVQRMARAQHQSENEI